MLDISCHPARRRTNVKLQVLHKERGFNENLGETRSRRVRREQFDAQTCPSATVTEHSNEDDVHHHLRGSHTPRLRIMSGYVAPGPRKIPKIYEGLCQVRRPITYLQELWN